MTLRVTAVGVLQYDAHSAISRRRLSNRSPRRYAVSTPVEYRRSRVDAPKGLLTHPSSSRVV
jgi:hypothetical protein